MIWLTDDQEHPERPQTLDISRPRPAARHLQTPQHTYQTVDDPLVREYFHSREVRGHHSGH